MATAWRITATAGTFEVNDEADDDGVVCIGNIPEGWDAAEAATEFEDRVDADGVIPLANRLGGRQLVARFRLFAPSSELMWNRRNLVEAVHMELVADLGLLVVDEPGQFKSLDVLSHRKPTIRQRTGASFEVTWPLMAPDPAKANYP